MHPELLPLLAPIAEYDRQAKALLAAHRAGDPKAIDVFHQNHPRFLDDTVRWLPKRIPEQEIRDTALDLDDARLTLARCYSYRDWAALTDHVSAIGKPGSAIHQYETAAEAVITGDVATLRSMLAAHPSLARARSERATCHDPSVHRATLLHYLGANGIEGHRQRSPKNAVEVAAVLGSPRAHWSPAPEWVKPAAPLSKSVANTVVGTNPGAHRGGGGASQMRRLQEVSVPPWVFVVLSRRSSVQVPPASSPSNQPRRYAGGGLSWRPFSTE